MLPVLWRALFCLSLVIACFTLALAEPKVQILSPKDGTGISQEQDTILVNGKVSTLSERSPNVDILFVIDTSGSTARYAGVDFGDPTSPSTGGPGWGWPQISIGGFGIGNPPPRDLRNSILAAEIAASRRLLSQLNAETTRVGIITFAEDARLVQPLTHDFALAKQGLENILVNGPYGGTNMAAAIRLAVRELAGLGQSSKRVDAIKTQFFLTDGIPTLPIGNARRAAPEDTELAISAARISGKAGVKIYAFALGDEALSYPRAPVGMAQESGGIFTPVTRPADILGVLERTSVVGINYVQMFNETTGLKASHLRLAADGFFSAAVPVVEGVNRIQVVARASDGSLARDTITVNYHRSDRRSLDVEVFLEKEKSLDLQVDRLGRSKETVDQEINQNREDSRQRSQTLPPAAEGPPR